MGYTASTRRHPDRADSYRVLSGIHSPTLIIFGLLASTFIRQ